MLYKEHLCETIKTERTKMNLSQETLAEKIGKSAGLIGQIERGETEPSLSSFRDILLTLNIDANEALALTNSSHDDSYTQSLLIVIERMTPRQKNLLYQIALLIQEFHD